MSILIKGMEMPTSCDDCNCFIRDSDGSDYCCLLMQDIEDNGKRDDDCPVVPVPPHGRLIDADALGNSLERLAADKWNKKAAPVNWSYAFEECLEMVDNAPTIIEQNFIKEPTIIPAEEGE